MIAQGSKPIKDRHTMCRGLEANLNAQIKRLKAEKRELKQLARELNKFVVHDACAGDDGQGIDSTECNCGLDDAQSLYRRLMR